MFETSLHQLREHRQQAELRRTLRSAEPRVRAEILAAMRHQELTTQWPAHRLA